MKKILLLIIGISIYSSSTAQVRIGLRLAPYINTTGVEYSGPDSTALTPGSPGFRYSAGPFVDAFFGENYAFSTGLFFSTRKTSVRERTPSGNVEGVVNLQYIQIPVTLKLFTNEISDDIKLYFQLGGSADVKIAGKVKDNNNASDGTRSFNICLVAGAGIEYELGSNTAILLGISYNRGLINTLSEKSAREVANVNHNMIGLDLGIRF